MPPERDGRKRGGGSAGGFRLATVGTRITHLGADPAELILSGGEEEEFCTCPETLTCLTRVPPPRSKPSSTSPPSGLPTTVPVSPPLRPVTSGGTAGVSGRTARRPRCSASGRRRRAGRARTGDGWSACWQSPERLLLAKVRRERRRSSGTEPRRPLLRGGDATHGCRSSLLGSPLAPPFINPFADVKEEAPPPSKKKRNRRFHAPLSAQIHPPTK